MEHHSPSFFADPRLWVAVAFTIFFLIFGRKLFGALLGILDKRTVDIRTELDEAARLRREAEVMLDEAKAQRTTALHDAEAMLSHAHAEASRVADAARADAATAAKRREQQAMDRIAAAEKAAVTDVRLAAIEVAARAAEQVIAKDLGPEADARLMDQAIQGLPAALASRQAA